MDCLQTVLSQFDFGPDSKGCYNGFSHDFIVFVMNDVNAYFSLVTVYTFYYTTCFNISYGSKININPYCCEQIFTNVYYVFNRQENKHFMMAIPCLWSYLFCLT